MNPKQAKGKTVTTEKTHSGQEDKWRRVAAELRRSEENFRRSLDDSPLGVRIVTEEGETIYANRAILNIYGYDCIEELKTTPIKQRYTPESYADFQIRRENRKQGVDVPSEYGVSIVRKSGEVRLLQVFRRAILWNGEKQFQVIYQDVTERNRAEKALRGAETLWRLSIDNMLEAYALHEALFDKNGRMVDYRFLEFNPAAQKISNIAREKIVGRTALELYPHIVERGLMDRYAEVMTTGVPAVIEDFYYDGDHLDKAFGISCFRIDERHFVCLFHDITASKKTDFELRASREQMRALAKRLQAAREEERTNIAREIHDELGGALTGLKIDLSFLARDALKLENETVRTSWLSGIDSLMKSIDTTIQTVRRIAMELRPGVLDDLGLIAALEWLLSDFQKRTGIRCKWIPSFEHMDLDTNISTAVSGFHPLNIWTWTPIFLPHCFASFRRL